MKPVNLYFLEKQLKPAIIQITLYDYSKNSKNAQNCFKEIKKIEHKNCIDALKTLIFSLKTLYAQL